jgi:hypothetical protein
MFAIEWRRGAMKFQVGRFTAELSLDDNGEIKTQWRRVFKR